MQIWTGMMGSGPSQGVLSSLLLTAHICVSCQFSILQSLGREALVLKLFATTIPLRGNGKKQGRQHSVHTLQIFLLASIIQQRGSVPLDHIFPRRSSDQSVTFGT